MLGTNLPKEFLHLLYREMLRIRLFEEGLVEPIISGEIKTPCHLCSGQEAVAVGLCAALEREDYVFGNHRSHGHYLAKGGSMKAMAAEIFCRETGCSRGRGGSMHLVERSVGMLGSAPIVAGTIPLATGAALASQIQGDGRVVVSFFGDGATGEGVLYESLNFAALRKLPIVFACENNLYATHMPIRECRVDQPVNRIAEPFGIQSLRVDGNDVLRVYEAGKNAVDTCRAGNGPVFVEFLTYRLRGHVGPDDNIQGCHTDIRPEAEIEQWRERDPVGRFEQWLLQNCDLDSPAVAAIEQEVKEEVRQALLYAMNSPKPGRECLNESAFA